MDETGFAPTTSKTHAYSLIATSIYADVDSQTRPRTSLIGGYRNNKLIAPFLLNGNCNTLVVNAWLKDHLLPILKKGSVIVMVSAVFIKHKKQGKLLRKLVALYYSYRHIHHI